MHNSKKLIKEKVSEVPKNINPEPTIKLDEDPDIIVEEKEAVNIISVNTASADIISCT